MDFKGLEEAMLYFSVYCALCCGHDPDPGHKKFVCLKHPMHLSSSSFIKASLVIHWILFWRICAGFCNLIEIISIFVFRLVVFFVLWNRWMRFWHHFANSHLCPKAANLKKSGCVWNSWFSIKNGQYGVLANTFYSFTNSVGGMLSPTGKRNDSINDARDVVLTPKNVQVCIWDILTIIIHPDLYFKAIKQCINIAFIRGKTLICVTFLGIFQYLENCVMR